MKINLKELGITAAVLIPLFISNISAFAVAQMPTVKLGDKSVVKLEVASTQREIERGLMYRTFLPEDNGMVFLFHPPQSIKFWMYHTLIPLDMCFVYQGKILKICHNVPPCQSENPRDCPTYPEKMNVTVSEVIELSGGYTEKHGIKEGDSVSFEFPDVKR